MLTRNLDLEFFFRRIQCWKILKKYIAESNESFAKGIHAVLQKSTRKINDFKAICEFGFCCLLCSWNQYSVVQSIACLGTKLGFVYGAGLLSNRFLDLKFVISLQNIVDISFFVLVHLTLSIFWGIKWWFFTLSKLFNQEVELLLNKVYTEYFPSMLLQLHRYVFSFYINKSAPASALIELACLPRSGAHPDLFRRSAVSLLPALRRLHIFSWRSVSPLLVLCALPLTLCLSLCLPTPCTLSLPALCRSRLSAAPAPGALPLPALCRSRLPALCRSRSLRSAAPAPGALPLPALCRSGSHRSVAPGSRRSAAENRAPRATARRARLSPSQRRGLLNITRALAEQTVKFNHASLLHIATSTSTEISNWVRKAP